MYDNNDVDTFLMFDGSNFDAHQHALLIHAVDHQVIKKYLKTICLSVGLTYI